MAGMFGLPNGSLKPGDGGPNGSWCIMCGNISPANAEIGGSLGRSSNFDDRAHIPAPGDGKGLDDGVIKDGGDTDIDGDMGDEGAGADVRGDVVEIGIGDEDIGVGVYVGSDDDEELGEVNDQTGAECLGSRMGMAAGKGM